jgi:hypothetical protein
LNIGLPLVVVAVLLPGCRIMGGSQPACSGNLQPYKGKCLTNTAIVYVECTEGRGISPTTEIGGAVAGTFRVVANASLKLAYKRSEKEDTPVALQVVHDCLKIAEQASDVPAEQGVARGYERQVDAQIAQWQAKQVQQTPHISLSRNSAAVGERISVEGRHFWPNETVDIYVHATLVKQLAVDGRGHFRTTIEVPSGAPPMSTTVSVTGETSSASAQAPFSAT